MGILLSKAKTSICEIILDDGYGSGFICQIKYDNNILNCLITNYHVITEFMILYKNDIEIKIDNEISKISFKKYRRIWIDESIDFTCIEILKEDNLIEKVDPFEIDENCYIKNYNIEEYGKRDIIIPSIGFTKENELGQGIVLYSENYNDIFFHDCIAKSGFSGGPIILINSLKIIGIHKGYEKNVKKILGYILRK